MIFNQTNNNKGNVKNTINEYDKKEGVLRKIISFLCGLFISK